MKRGEVYMVREFGTSGSEMKKTRPWVVIGANPINRARRTVVAVPLSTSQPESYPVSIQVAAMGLRVVAVCDQIRAIDKGSFIHPASDQLSSNDLAALEEGLRKILVL
jgi:mRNA interferase MazF